MVGEECVKAILQILLNVNRQNISQNEKGDKNFILKAQRFKAPNASIRPSLGLEGRIEGIGKINDNKLINIHKSINENAEVILNLITEMIFLLSELKDDNNESNSAINEPSKENIDKSLNDLNLNLNSNMNLIKSNDENSERLSKSEASENIIYEDEDFNTMSDQCKQKLYEFENKVNNLK